MLFGYEWMKACIPVTNNTLLPFGQYSVRISNVGRGKSMQAPTKRTVFSWLTSLACFISHNNVEVISTFFLQIFLMATRSPLKMPMVVNSWVGGSDEQLPIDARPELMPNCCSEKLCKNNGNMNHLGWWELWG